MTTNYYKPLEIETEEIAGIKTALTGMRLPKKQKKSVEDLHPLSESSRKLSSNLVLAGDSHAKFARSIFAFLKIKMQVGFMLELDTYRIGREVISTSSSMHNELKHLTGVALAEKKQADLPHKVYTQSASYSYQCLRNIYLSRRNHRHPDWQIFCDHIEGLPLFHVLIVPSKATKSSTQHNLSSCSGKCSEGCTCGS